MKKYQHEFIGIKRARKNFKEILALFNKNI